MSLYVALKLWTENDRSWVAYEGRNPRDTAIGPASPTGTRWGDNRACECAIDWARSQGLTIKDERAVS